MMREGEETHNQGRKMDQAGKKRGKDNVDMRELRKKLMLKQTDPQCIYRN